MVVRATVTVMARPLLRACLPSFDRQARSSPGAPHRGRRVAGQQAGAVTGTHDLVRVYETPPTPGQGCDFPALPAARAAACCQSGVSGALGRAETGFKVSQDVVDVLQADRQPDQP